MGDQTGGGREPTRAANATGNDRAVRRKAEMTDMADFSWGLGERELAASSPLIILCKWDYRIPCTPYYFLRPADRVPTHLAGPSTMAFALLVRNPTGQ
jgi:hypothetical protein